MIKRVLSDEFLASFMRDFRNLIKIVNASMGELDLAIRENYFNLYYKGNSLGNISPLRAGGYKVRIPGRCAGVFCEQEAGGCLRGGDSQC